MKITLELDNETVSRLKSSGARTSGQSAEILGMEFLEAWNKAIEKKKAQKKTQK